MLSLLAGLLLLSPRLELMEKYHDPAMTPAKRWNFLEINMMNFSHVEDEWQLSRPQYALHRRSIDPLIWYLQQPDSDGKFTKNIDLLLRYLTDLPSVNGYLYKIIPNGRNDKYMDTFFTLCARYGHLDLLNLYIDNYFTEDFDGIELNTHDSLLHVLAQNCEHLEYQKIITKLIKNTRIDIRVKNKNDELFTTIIENNNNPNCSNFTRKLKRDEMYKYMITLYVAIDKNDEPLTKWVLKKIIAINQYHSKVLVCIHLNDICIMHLLMIDRNSAKLIINRK